jgi:hypothetical protein
MDMAVPNLSVDPASVAAARIGKPSKLVVISNGLTAFDWVIVRPDAHNTWRTQPVTVQTTGRVEIEFTPEANGEFVKLLTLDRKLAVDSAKVADPNLPALAPVPVPAPLPSGDAAAAQRFVAPLGAGMNIERGRAWAMQYQGKSLNKSPEYYRYLAGLGLTHVRFFMPVRPDVDMIGQGLTNGRMPDNGLIDTLLDACDCAIDQGLKVFVDWTDVIGADEIGAHWGSIADYLDRVGQRIASRATLSPTMICPGPFNELLGGSNGDFNKFRIDAHTILRKRLPQHVLLTGAANWNDWKYLVDKDWQMVPDRRVIAQWHHYEDATRGRGFWGDVQAKLRDFSTRSGGIPTFAGEAGPDEGWTGNHVGFSDRWIASIDDQAASIAAERPTWWAITDGSAFRLSCGGSDATLRSEIEEVIRRTSTKIKASLGVGR